MPGPAGWPARPPVPAPPRIRDLLAALLGRPVEVAVDVPLVPAPDEPHVLTVYLDDRHRLAAVGVLDLALAAYAGAALGLVPAPVARELVDAGQLRGDLAENVAEVANVLGALFNLPGAPHLRLHQVFVPGELPPADVSVLARTVGRRVDLAVTLAGYGAGRLALVARA